MKVTIPKLYNIPEGFSYHIFPIDGGGVVVEGCKDGEVVSHCCCNEHEWEEYLECIPEERQGQVVQHQGTYEIIGIKPSE